MLYFIIIFSFFSVFILKIEAAETGFLTQKNIKDSIANYQDKIQKAPQDQKSALSLKLAVAYLNDQDQEKAFREFLIALETASSKKTPFTTEQEKDAYEKGYKIYLEKTPSSSPKDIALKLYQEFKQTADTHREYYLLNLLMSTVYANLNRYEEFFNVFYHSYQYYSDHYLSYKTKAGLHIKLFEKSRTIDERQREQKNVFKNIALAIDKNPLDVGLYKVAMMFASKEDHAKVVENSLNDIIKKNILIPRHDIGFFVNQAVSSKQYDLAQKFVDKSREWYQYSRYIAEAQEHIDQHR
jgi:hypothetical protein